MADLKEIFLTPHEAQSIFGRSDENLRYLEDMLGVRLVGRGNLLKIKGGTSNVERAMDVISQLQSLVKNQGTIHKHDILAVADGMRSDIPEENGTTGVSGAAILIDSRKKEILPRTPGQKSYISAIRKYDLTLAIGPAGTGKTYLAVACAVEAVKKGQFHRVILTRPAIEAGERLGFLPGDLEEKIKPYLQPIYDALYDILRYEELKRWMERRVIEIVPLAYMRGRTLSEAFIILDEAQNTTCEQMKMFLTRLGMKSKAVITGDITQIDLPLNERNSGLIDASRVLKDIQGVKFVRLSRRDVVRHPLVKKIINAYEHHHGGKEHDISYSKQAEGEAD